MICGMNAPSMKQAMIKAADMNALFKKIRPKNII